MVEGQPPAHVSCCRGAIVYAIVLERTIQSLTHAARSLCWLGRIWSGCVDSMSLRCCRCCRRWSLDLECEVRIPARARVWCGEFCSLRHLHLHLHLHSHLPLSAATAVSGLDNKWKEHPFF